MASMLRMHCRPETLGKAEKSMTGDRIATYPQFWRYYLREHAKPATRAWHYLGTSLTLLCVLAALVARQPWFLLAAVILGYAPAWIGHFASEKNRPATFRYPLWSLYSDFRMFGTWISGRMPAALADADVNRATGSERTET
jgi:hypothetical protein